MARNDNASAVLLASAAQRGRRILAYVADEGTVNVSTRTSSTGVPQLGAHVGVQFISDTTEGFAVSLLVF